MKNQILANLALIGVIGLSAPAAYSQAGGNTGGGGGGILKDGHVYVVDLVESGVEKNPYFDPSVSADPVMQQRVAKALQEVPDVPVNLIVRKINELYLNYDRATALQMIEAMELFSWELLDLNLVKIEDENLVVNIPIELQVQLAARIYQSVKLNRNYWKELDPANKAALIIHEVIYSLTINHNSDTARKIVGYMFTPNFKTHGLWGFKNIIGNDLFFLGNQIPLLECAPGSTLPDCSGRVGVLFQPDDVRTHLAIFTNPLIPELKSRPGPALFWYLVADGGPCINNACVNVTLVDAVSTNPAPTAKDYATSVISTLKSVGPNYSQLKGDRSVPMVMTGYDVQTSLLSFKDSNGKWRSNGAFLKGYDDDSAKWYITLIEPGMPVTANSDVGALSTFLTQQIQELVDHVSSLYK